MTHPCSQFGIVSPYNRPGLDNGLRKWPCRYTLPRELTFTTSTLVAFGSTRRPRGKVDDDATLRNLIEANTSAVCIVAKSWDYHVLEALQTTLDEGAAMIADSVEYLKGHGRLVMVDMEHFFDGYKSDPDYALRTLAARCAAAKESSLDEMTDALWDDWAESKLRAFLDATELAVGRAGLSPDLAFNTAVSFTTNTNWHGNVASFGIDTNPTKFGFD
mgnify:CR=1 FL=1